MIRVDALWLSTTPLDMRAGTETILARVVQVFGEARPHHAYLFANRRANRMKVLVHDGHGIWLANRRLNQGRFCWRQGNASVELTRYIHCSFMQAPLKAVCTHFEETCQQPAVASIPAQ